MPCGNKILRHRHASHWSCSGCAIRSVRPGSPAACRLPSCSTCVSQTTGSRPASARPCVRSAGPWSGAIRWRASRRRSGCCRIRSTVGATASPGNIAAEAGISVHRVKELRRDLLNPPYDPAMDPDAELRPLPGAVKCARDIAFGPKPQRRRSGLPTP